MALLHLSRNMQLNKFQHIIRSFFVTDATFVFVQQRHVTFQQKFRAINQRFEGKLLPP